MNAKTGVGPTSTDVGRGFSTTGPFPKSNPRFEIARLRQVLARSEAVASRYAMMVREGDHRIKNSLQIVTALMTLQAHREESVSAREALRAAAARIESISRIHDALQETGGEDSVDLGAVLETMCRSLHAMAGDPRSVSIFVAAEPIQTPVALAQPIVLVVNELVVNALRHAFSDNRPGTIRVTAAQTDGELRIVVADDGDGLPSDYAEGNGYGMTLVRMMAAQIHGVLHVENRAGAHFTLAAPAPAPGFASERAIG
jgi:two-component system, sensor histidine kinase PdtaS